ncbi:MAG: alkyl sulfatase dimerization domain-containing protein [Promethearchaeota archaeon]
MLDGFNINAFFGLEPPREFLDDFLFINSFGNVGVVNTGVGLVLFDLGLEMAADKIYKAVREFFDAPVRYIIISHGHFDHGFGFRPFFKEIDEMGWDKPEIIVHENLLARYAKYKMLDDYHVWINRMQFSSVIKADSQGFISSTGTLKPTVVVRHGESHSFKLGSYSFNIYSAMGETDDALWMHVPDRGVIFTGDLIVSSFPNIGNPYKVQRYPKHWANALDNMLKFNADYLLPGHGNLIEGRASVKECLTVTRDVLNFVHNEVVKRLNKEKWFDEIYREMLEIYPERFSSSPYLQPIYGDYRFAIHCVYRLYHGWYQSGNPTDLFPSRREAVAGEVLGLIGDDAGPKIFKRVKSLMDEGHYQLSMHLLDLLIFGSKERGVKNANELDRALKLKIRALRKLANSETSFIAKNIINNGARELVNERKRLKNSDD